MNEAQALADIVRTLTIDHGCHAVILYGSRARGNFQLASDWDVAGIREGGATATLRVARAFHGAWLDAFVYSEAAFTVIDPELLRFLPARILVDERGFAKTLLERVDLLNQQGPPPLPEGEDEMVRVWYAKTLARIARGDLESKYRRVELLYQALEDYFKLRGLWYRGAKAALPWLAGHDPETHAAVARAFKTHASLEDLRALVDHILPARRAQQPRDARQFLSAQRHAQDAHGPCAACGRTSTSPPLPNPEGVDATISQFFKEMVSRERCLAAGI